jgi:hypothetical protein
VICLPFEFLFPNSKKVLLQHHSMGHSLKEGGQQTTRAGS